MIRRYFITLSFGLAVLLLPGAAHATFLNTVNWSVDGTPDGIGTGVLNGTNTVTYTTAVGSAAGTTIAENFNTSLATAGTVGTGATFLTAGVLGTANLNSLSITTETITFSQAITNPILLLNIASANEALSFPANSLPVTVLASHNAQLVPTNVITFGGATGTVNDGLALQLTGTFGPGNPLVFNFSSSAAFSTLAFTVGTTSTSVPEPASMTLSGIGMVLGLGYAVRRRRQAIAA